MSSSPVLVWCRRLPAVSKRRKRLIAGESGARRITEFEVDDLACQIACRIPVGDGTNGTFNADLHMEPKEQRKVDPFIVYAVGAADQALDDADWHPESDEDRVRTGVLMVPALAVSKVLSRLATRCATKVRAAFLRSLFTGA